MTRGLSEFSKKANIAVNSELEKNTTKLFPEKDSELGEIFRYHLGLGDKKEKRGKRIRPLLTLLCTEGAGADWKTAIPAATAIELVHNFSLIHDDIEDNGELRRGKEAVWKRWGLAKGLNAGDAMFAAAFFVLTAYEKVSSSNIDLKTIELLSNTCVKLTEGQQMDIDFEFREMVTQSEYFEMIDKKTAELISCSTLMGATIGGLEKRQQILYEDYGRNLGIAFQIYDDWLGIWGDPEITGKSASSDLMEGKKSLPIILGLKYSKKFRISWKSGNFTAASLEELSNYLEEGGVKKMVENEYRLWTDKALESLENMHCRSGVKIILIELTNKLLTRIN